MDVTDFGGGRTERTAFSTTSRRRQVKPARERCQQGTQGSPVAVPRPGLTLATQDRGAASLLPPAGNPHLDTASVPLPQAHLTSGHAVRHCGTVGGSSGVWRRGVEDPGSWSRTTCIVPEAALGRRGQHHRARIRADAGPFRTCQRGLCLSMHTIFSPKAPYFSPMSQPFSQSFITSSPGAGTGYEISLPAGYC